MDVKNIDKRTPLRRKYLHNRNVACTLTKSVQISLLVNSRRQVDRALEDIVACLKPMPGKTDIQGGYTMLKWWYRNMSARTHETLRLDMEKFTGDYTVL